MDRWIDYEDLADICGRTWVEVDLAQARTNMAYIRSHVRPETKVGCVVKADAYGLGAEVLSRVFLNAGGDFIIVACLDEALALRKSGYEEPILMLSDHEPERYPEGLTHDITYTVSTLEEAQALAEAGAKASRRAKVHLNIDTGMGRLGFKWDDPDLALVLKKLQGLNRLDIEGVYTHFATADGFDCQNEAASFHQKQFKRFLEVKKLILSLNLHPRYFHCANSPTTMLNPEMQLDLVRPGLILYGIPTDNMEDPGPLKPLASVHSRVSLVKHMKAGESVSYGRRYVADRDRSIAVVPIGYADGYARLMTGKAHALIRDRRAELLGVITMDQAMFALDGMEDIKPGEPVVLMGEMGEEAISPMDWARWQSTIPYEVLTSLTARLPRVYIDSTEKPGRALVCKRLY